MNNKSNGSGCLTAILVFSFFAGNIFLFGGDLASGGDLEGNSIAIIMVIIAIIVDIVLIGLLFLLALKILRNEKKKEKDKE